MFDFDKLANGCSYSVPIIVILAIIVVVVLGIPRCIETNNDDTKFKEIANEVHPLIAQCKSKGSSNEIMLSGKAVVLDADAELPKNYVFFGEHLGFVATWKLRAHADDKRITIFMVSTTKLDKCANYGTPIEIQKLVNRFEDPIPGYCARYDIYVIYWPEKQAVGMKTIISQPPAELTFKAGHAPTEWVGNAADIYSWIETLPTINQ
jgi:hypothetical protein